MQQNKQENKCELCGEPMPIGEEMFKYHGYSGDCPKPPLDTLSTPENTDIEEWEKEFEEFALINDFYLRGIPMGKLKSFIRQALLKAEQKGREAERRELREKVEIAKARALDASDYKAVSIFEDFLSLLKAKE